VSLTAADDDVVLVDHNDLAIGRCAKLDAHQSPGVRHRAFSVVIFDERNRMLLQRRAATKYHFGGRWSNSCCGHPRPDEDIVVAATRRLGEEMGFGVPLTVAGRFEYWAEDEASGLVEHEIDHVLYGRVGNQLVLPSPAEVDEWRWVDRVALEQWMLDRPGEFTPWFASVMQNMWAATP
jgi:isopentenyl-diphosphate delta-isomerase